jgi:hypothetical protein
LFRLALFLLLLLVSVNASDSPVLPSEPLKSADGLAASVSNSALGRQRSAESSLPNNEPTKKTQHNGRWQAFIASFAVIFVSEIGDKTFLIAAIMAMKNRRSTSTLFSQPILTSKYIIPSLFGRFICSGGNDCVISWPGLRRAQFNIKNVHSNAGSRFIFGIRFENVARGV